MRAIRFGDGLVAGVLSCALLALGGATQHCATAIGVAALAVAFWQAARQRLRVTPLSWALWGLAGWTAFSCIPFPVELLRSLGAPSLELKQRTWELLGVNPTVTGLALERGAASSDAHRLVIYGVWASAMAHWVRRAGQRKAAAVVVWVCFSVLVVTLAHQLAGASAVYGIYLPKRATLVGPLMNGNNLGGVMSVGALAAVGLAVQRRSGSGGMGLWLFVACALSVGCVLSGSRAAAFVLACSLALFMLLQTRRFPSRPRGLVVATVAVVAVSVVVLSWSRVGPQLGETSTEKLLLLRSGFRALADFAWLGSGRGAFFASVSPFLPRGVGNESFEYAENFVLEACLGWGLPVGLAAVGLLAVALIRAGKHARSSSCAGALYIACVGWWAQNLLDLGTEIYGVGLFGISLTSIVLGSSARRQPVLGTPTNSEPLLRPLWFGGILLAGLGFFWLARPPLRDLREGVAAKPGGLGLDQVLREHPADPYFLRLGALRAWEARAPNAIAWANVALRQAPQDGRIWLILGQALAFSGHTGQAQSVLAHAVAVDPALARPVAHNAAALFGARAVDLPLSGPAGSAAMRLIAAELPELADRVKALAAAVDLAPADYDARLAAVATVLGLPEPVCREALGEGCRALVERLAGAPGSTVAHARIRASILMADGNLDAAYELLWQRCPRTEEAIDCLWQLFRAAGPEAIERQQATAQIIESAACGDPKRCAAAHQKLARALEQMGRQQAALYAWQRAALISGELVVWRRVLLSALALKDVRLARRAVSELDRAGGEVSAAERGQLGKLLIGETIQR